MRKTLAFAIAAGLAFSRAALACEDGPECQDPSPKQAPVAELQPAPSTPSRYADARPRNEPTVEAKSAGSEAATQTAQR